MKLSEFLLYHTQAEELCVICNPWIVASVWIDHEDLFIGYVNAGLKKATVVKDEWNPLVITSDNGTHMSILAHYIYVEE